MSTSYGSSPMERRQHGDSERSSDEKTSSDKTASNTDDLDTPRDRRSVVAAQKEQYGGMKIGSAFFGWLTATGIAILLTAVVAASGTVVAVATNTDVGNAASEATRDASTVGVFGTVVLLAILFLAYFCGGYVAGRMARFNGVKQGIAVWLWALVIAVVAAIVGAVGGSAYNILAQLNSFPRIPVNEGSLSTGGIMALVAVAIASLAGAILGGLAGMRFHRNVDRAGLGG